MQELTIPQPTAKVAASKAKKPATKPASKTATKEKKTTKPKSSGKGELMAPHVPMDSVNQRP